MLRTALARPSPGLFTLLLTPLAAGCAPGPVDIASGTTASTAQAVTANPRHTHYRNRPYNWSGQGHTDTCVRLRHDPAALRYSDGTPTGLVLTNAMLQMVNPPIPACTGTDAMGNPTPPNCGNADRGHGRFRATDGATDCPAGYARLDAREVLRSHDGALLFHRGGWGFVGGDAAAAVRFGHVLASDLEGNVRTEQSHAMTRSQGNGSPCQLGRHHYRIHVESIPQDQWYMNSKGTSVATTYTIYGDAGADLGTPEERAQGIHFTLLNWSWVNVSGGGVARAVLRDGQEFQLCRHVPSIRMASLTNDGHPDGWVRAVYGGTTINGHTIYGWVVASHRHGTDRPVRHLRR